MAAAEGRGVGARRSPDLGADGALDPARLPSVRAFGRYRVEATLGGGGMGVVYRVVDGPAGKRLALKRLVVPSGVARERAELLFRREFHTLATLRHPRIVEAFEFGTEGSELFYTMELLEGQDLRDLAPVPLDRACALLRDVASALAFLHARRLVHRDLSPRNVRCTPDGQAKLIDFGVMATTGVVGEIAGTPPAVPPEVVRLAPLDHRADLYGLGALGYWLLTGRHAFPAKSLAELNACWRTPPPAPSALAPGIPLELDLLVLSLLHGSPSARPASAAEVIERLGSIGRIPRAPELETERGWLASATLVGRDGETTQADAAIADALAGQGSALLVEAPSGMGKSRLLREIGLQAQIAGLTVVSVEPDAAGRGPWGVLRAIAAGLMAAAPGVTADAARPWLPAIARAVPEVADRFGKVDSSPLSGDPREERAVILSALLAWLLEVARRRPFALVLDDVQRSDEASASLIAALSHEAREHPLLVVAAVRTDEAARAPVALAATEDAARRLRLGGLEQRHVHALANGLFGEVPNLTVLSAWMHARAGGSPLLCVELARHVVEHGIVRYVEGIWVIPQELSGAGTPESLADAMDARVRELGAPALALGQVLAVRGGPFALEAMKELAGAVPESEVFRAMDELIAEEVFVGTREAYRFRHDGVREALLRSFGPERGKLLHLRIGEALLGSGTVDPDAEALVGWHLLRGGDETRGARLLESAGRRLYDSQSYHDAVEPLCAAVTAYERRGASPDELVELRFMLVCAGFLCDRELSLRYADVTLESLRTFAGLDTADRLRDTFGSRLSLGLGFSWALASWSAARPFRARPSPPAALQMFVVATLFTAAVALASFDLPRLNALVRSMESLRVLKRIPVLHACTLQVTSLRDVWTARFEPAARLARETLDQLSRDRLLPVATRKMAEGGAHFVIALSNLMDEASPEALQPVEALERLGVKTWELGAVQLRMSYHALRGEEDRVARTRAQAEELLLQLGSAWQMEVWVPPILAFAYSMSRDLIGMKQTIEQIARLHAAGFPFERTLEWLRSEYYRERGELDLALSASDRAIATATEIDMVFHPILTGRAEIFLALGDLASAKALSRECIGVAREPGRRRLGLIARSTRTLALAEALDGNAPLARRLLTEALAEAAFARNPVTLGSLHEAAARVALVAGDGPLFRLHCREAAALYRPTHNPVLIGRAERLLESLDGSSHAPPPLADAIARDAVTEVDSGSYLRSRMESVLRACRGHAERAERAHELVLHATAAASGFLYLSTERGLVLAAPLHGDEPPPDLHDKLAACVRRLLDGDETMTGPPPEPTDFPTVVTGAAAYEPVLLLVEQAGRRLVAGISGVRAGAVALAVPGPHVISAIAEILVELGDVVPLPVR